MISTTYIIIIQNNRWILSLTDIQVLGYDDLHLLDCTYMDYLWLFSMDDIPKGLIHNQLDIRELVFLV